MELTERQEESLAEDLKDAQEVYGVEGISRERVSIAFIPEVRPGRGCNIEYFYSSGEFIVSGFIDVYGRSRMAIGEVEWVHNSANEYCECTPCKEFEERQSGID